MTWRLLLVINIVVFIALQLGWLLLVKRNYSCQSLDCHTETSTTISLQVTRPPGIKIILFYTKFFRKNDFYVGFGREAFKHCAEWGYENNCLTTDDKRLINDADAVIFHGHTDNLVVRDLPRNNRKPWQRWILYCAESPMRSSKLLYKKLDGIYNWTMTYRLDSDLNYYYGGFVKNSTPWQYQNQAVGKTKLVAWVASNCNTAGRRLQYVSALSKYLPIDIYGKCGDLNCEGENCWSELEQKYKFFLAFENNICADYATEKLYRTMMYNIVPVVMGGANYSRIAPPHSVINVFNFSSAKQLAEYLLMLDKNDDKYNEYFSWKRDFSAELWNKRSFCALCDKLHDKREGNKVYTDLYKWWFHRKCVAGHWSDDGEWLGKPFAWLHE